MGRTCVLCGKDVSKWCLDFTADVQCDTCTKTMILFLNSKIDGEWLKAYREYKGYSQNRLATELSVTRQAINSIESSNSIVSNRMKQEILRNDRLYIRFHRNPDLVDKMLLKTNDLQGA